MLLARVLHRLYGVSRGLCNATVGALTGLGLMISASVADASTLVVALGDSLTAGYGLPPENALPARLEARLKREGFDIVFQNAGVSGDTSAGGLARVDWATVDNPKYVLVALGANDMLRGVDPATTRANLDAILTALKARGIRPILLGMRAQPNLGSDYVTAFERIYPELAAKHGVPLFPFMLDGVATVAALNLPDGMHPNARGVEVMVDRIAPFLADVLRKG